MLYALQTLLAPHSTQYIFGRTVVQLEIFLLYHLFGLRLQMELCL